MGGRTAPRRALANFPISGPDHTKGQRAPWRRLAPHGRMRTIPGANDIYRDWTARSCSWLRPWMASWPPARGDCDLDSHERQRRRKRRGGSPRLNSRALLAIIVACRAGTTASHASMAQQRQRVAHVGARRGGRPAPTPTPYPSHCPYQNLFARSPSMNRRGEITTTP